MARTVTAGHEALRASEHDSTERPAYTHELQAFNRDGEPLYRTEPARSKEAAEQHCKEVNTTDALKRINSNRSSEKRVDHFEVVEYE